jgi:hypothetical protein
MDVSLLCICVVLSCVGEISLVQTSPTACLIVCVITETPKGALYSSWERQENEVHSTQTNISFKSSKLRPVIQVMPVQLAAWSKA